MLTRSLRKGDTCRIVPGKRGSYCVHAIHHDNLREWMSTFFAQENLSNRRFLCKNQNDPFSIPEFSYAKITSDDCVVFLQRLNVNYFETTYHFASVLFKGKLFVTWYSVLEVI